jgi:hypothetical protein
MNSKEHQTEQIKSQIGVLFNKALDIHRPVQTLHLIREKMLVRGYQSLDKEDILQELGQMQYLLHQLNTAMLNIHDQLQK